MNKTEAMKDPFNLDNLRLSQDYASEVGVQKKLITVPVRKPNKSEFVRVHPDAAYHLTTLVLELKEQRNETYVIGPALRETLATESTVGLRRLVTTVNRQGVTFLWPLRLPGPDGRFDSWGQSALEIADLAVKNWVRVGSNTSLGAYEPFVAVASLSEPTWPTEPFSDLVKIAFTGKMINEYDHPVLKGLRGEL